jgi:hypothetical protein
VSVNERLADIERTAKSTDERHSQELRRIFIAIGRMDEEMCKVRAALNVEKRA